MQIKTQEKMKDYITISLILSCGISLGLNWLFLVRIQILESKSEKINTPIRVGTRKN